MVWNMHSRSRVWVRACISCKSLGQPEFYLLTWTHKVRFPGSGVSSNPKKKVLIIYLFIYLFNMMYFLFPIYVYHSTLINLASIVFFIPLCVWWYSWNAPKSISAYEGKVIILAAVRTHRRTLWRVFSWVL